MAYPERTPIYEAYKNIVKNIIDSKKYKEYAQAEIYDLNASLLRGFKDASVMMMMDKDWAKTDE